MDKNMIRSASVLAILGAITVASPASAGGLFGHGGLIRGSIGNWVHDNVQAPIVTPVLQAGTVIGGAAVGTYFGGPAGGAAGAYAGESVNSVFAGHGLAPFPTTGAPQAADDEDGDTSDDAPVPFDR